MMRGLRWWALLPAMLLVAGCEEESTSIPYTLCNPTLERAESPGEEPTSAGGGPLVLTGRNLWVYFSGTAGECPEGEPELVDAPGDTTITTAPYALPDELVVFVGSQSAEVVSAYERNVPTWLPLEVRGDDGQTQTKYVLSDCDTCRTCVDSSCNSDGCGGCESACIGCEQVIEVVVPPLLTTAGTRSDDGTTLTAPVRVISGINQSTAVYYPFLSACMDGVDNDGNDLVDEEDPSCFYSGGWSEQPACGDGLDNDGDGWIDAEEDAGCGADPAAFSELDACADGTDNDGDDLIDLQDPDCAEDPTGQSEETSTAAPACSNGRDDDLDGAIDHGDPRCTSGYDEDESAL